MSTILLAEARFYPHLNDMLLEGARAAIEAAGHKHETLTVPGALELPGAIALAARSGRFCAFVALGVVIRGETYHFEVVSNESARGLMDLTLQGYAIGNGILTVENEAQAIVRSDPDQMDKGGGAAKAALALFELREKYAPLSRLRFVERRIIDVAARIARIESVLVARAQRSADRDPVDEVGVGDERPAERDCVGYSFRHPRARLRAQS